MTPAASPVRRYNLRSHTPRHLHLLNPPLEPCGDFHLFARLPAEIRWLVWQHSLSHERWINITLNCLDYTYPAHEGRKLADPEGYNIVLGHRWKASKLFRTTAESRRAALAFYRVQLPCWHRGKDKVMSRGTLYVCPELDHLQLNSLKHFERFAHDLWACDPRHIGLVNLAMRATCLRDAFEIPGVLNNKSSVLRQGLSRIERLTMMNYRGSKKLWRPLNPQSRRPFYQMNHIVPIRSGVQSFDRLPYDPRLDSEDLIRVFLGHFGPRKAFNRWFELLSTLGVEHEHKVIYQFGSCRGYKTGYGYKDSPVISDRKSAAEWVLQDTDELRKWFESFHQPLETRSQIDHQIIRVFEESPQPVIGFWLFPMETFLTPRDPDIHGTDASSSDSTTVDMSQHMPELCLANIY